jgi:hypothetical protein
MKSGSDKSETVDEAKSEATLAKPSGSVSLPRRVGASLLIWLSMCLLHVLPATKATDEHPVVSTVLAIFACVIFTVGVCLLTSRPKTPNNQP